MRDCYYERDKRISDFEERDSITITTNREAGCQLTRIYEIDSLSHENSRGGRTAQRHSSATARE